jgi:hypothetical protein
MRLVGTRGAASPSVRTLCLAILLVFCGCTLSQRMGTSPTLVNAPLGRVRVLLTPADLAPELRARINHAIETSIKLEDFVAGVSYVLSVELESDPGQLLPNYRIRATLRDGRTAEFCASVEERCVLCNTVVLAEHLTRTARRLILEAEFGKPGKAAPDAYPPAGQGTAWN